CAYRAMAPAVCASRRESAPNNRTDSGWNPSPCQLVTIAIRRGVPVSGRTVSGYGDGITGRAVALSMVIHPLITASSCPPWVLTLWVLAHSHGPRETHDSHTWLV